MKNLPVLFLILAMFFNAFLAIINQHLFALSPWHVMASEGLILFAATCTIAYTKPAHATPWLLFAFAFTVLNVSLWLANQKLTLKPLRDMLIIPAFALLGMAASQSNITNLLRGLCIAILAVMLFEAAWPDAYIHFFNPASYYFNTRGIGDFQLDPAPFLNVERYTGRFSLAGEGASGWFGVHRLGSLFLEQTVLANFAVALALFLSAFWPQLNRTDRLFFASTILLILLGTDSRLALGTIAALSLGHLIFPKLPRIAMLAYLPLCLGAAWLLFYDSLNSFFTDTLPGRLNWTLQLLSHMSITDLLAGAPDKLANAADSGYAYLIYAHSLIGALLFWLFPSLALPQTTPGQKRFSHGLGLFMAFNLAVGATLFSIKGASLLWFMAGYVAVNRNKPMVGREGIEPSTN